MAKKNDKIALAALTAIMKNRMMNEAIVLNDIGSDIKHLAKKCGVKPKDLADVLVPIYKEAIRGALSPKAVKKSMKSNGGHYHSHHEGH